MMFCRDFRKAAVAVVSAVALLMPVAGVAGERPFTPAMTCAAARNAVQANGAIVLWTGQHLYDRYVDHNGFCPLATSTRAAWVPTRDNPQCFIGYTCEQTNGHRWRR